MGRISLLKEVLKEVGDRLAVCLAGGFNYILHVSFPRPQCPTGVCLLQVTPIALGHWSNLQQG